MPNTKWREKVIGWEIHYADGRTFTHQDGPPESAPLDGVLGIVEYYENGEPQVYSGGQDDYYCWTGDCWRAGNVADLERWLRVVLPQVKYGYWAPLNVWNTCKEKLKRLVHAETA